MKTTYIVMIVLAVSLTSCERVQDVPEPVDNAGLQREQELARAYGQAELIRSGQRIDMPLPVLQLLRQGQTDAACEALEGYLDAAIIKADEAKRSYRDAEHGSALNSLAKAKAYRQKHPRPEILKYPDVNLLDEHREAQRQKAEAILQRIDKE